MSSSAILSDALSVLTKTTHQVLADVEARSRSDVARSAAEVNEARHQRDKAIKDLHDSQLEAEAYRRELTVSKAAYAQAELTITHHLETLGEKIEIIAQLRREVNQWKDQSKNWQEHFLRVEQERCALSSRIDELVSERLMWSRNASNVYTPRSRHQEGVGSAADSSNRDNVESSPAQPSIHKVALLPNKGEADISTGPSKDSSTSKPSRKIKTIGSGLKKPGPRNAAPSTVDSPLSHVKASSSQPRQPEAARSANQQSTIRQSTLIRRVQAVVRVKREESEDEGSDPKAESSGPHLVEGSSKTHRRRSRMIIEDEKDESEGSDDADDHATVARNLRAGKAINYDEGGDNGLESEEDELMIGNEDNHKEVFGSSKPKGRKPQPSNGPPSKKRKVASRPSPR